MLSVLIGLALSATALGAAVASHAPTADTPPAANMAHEITYLGVALSPIPDAVGANLLANFPSGQGVLITSVEPDSPAAQAGLSANDILLSYGDQKLYSPRQLTALVRADKRGTEVPLDYVHQGEIAHTKVILASRADTPMATGQAPWQPWFGNAPLAMPAFPHWGAPPFGMAPPGWNLNTPPGAGSNVMEHFDSLSIQQTNGKYQIEMAYLDDAQVKHSFRYEGSAEEVSKVIKDDKSLPDDKRQQLLQALSMNGPAALPDIRSLMERMGMPGFAPWAGHGG
ncbi:MAG: PDZ domain-containing protein [Gammaproteobacteria bacterium]|nr:PDZ domain-containing protein [Gammaproteobacteria bacterium]